MFKEWMEINYPVVKPVQKQRIHIFKPLHQMAADPRIRKYQTIGMELEPLSQKQASESGEKLSQTVDI